MKVLWKERMDLLLSLEALNPEELPLLAATGGAEGYLAGLLLQYGSPLPDPHRTDSTVFYLKKGYTRE
jgi:hypothetical protein